MNDPQIWTLLAVTGALFFGMAAVISRSFNQTMRSGFDAVDARFDALDAKLSGRIDGLDAKLTGGIDAFDAKHTSDVGRLDAKVDERFDRLAEVMDARFTDVDHRLTTVEGDLGLVKGHLIGQRSA